MQYNLVYNQYQQKSEVHFHALKILCLFYAYFLNVEPSNLVFLKTYNTDFDKIIMRFMDQNGRPFEIEDKLNLTLVISKQKRHALRAEQRIIIL